jgi:hypothetical protein
MLDRSHLNNAAIPTQAASEQVNVASISPGQSIVNPSTLKGYELVGRFLCGAHPRVYLNHAATYGAIISDSDLTLWRLKDISLDRRVFTKESPILRNAHLGRGEFSGAGDHFALVVGSNPGKLLRMELPTLFTGDHSPNAVQHREFPPVSGRHVFSPSGEFLIAYPTTGIPMCITWNIEAGGGFLGIRSGDLFKLPGIPTAETVSTDGTLVAVGLRHSGGEFGLLIYNRGTREQKLIDYPSEISQLAFATDDSVLWVGDHAGYLACYSSTKWVSSKLINLNGVEPSPTRITALKSYGGAHQIICGTADGKIYRANLSQYAPMRGLDEVAELASGSLCSVASTHDGALLLMGFSSGEAAVYRRT